MINLVFFDFDYMLILIDSDYEWGCFMVKFGIVDVESFLCQNDQFFVDYKVGQFDIYVYLCVMFMLFVKYLCV